MKLFSLICIFRVLLLSGSLGLLIYLYNQTDFIAAVIFVALAAVYQIFALIRYVTRTNRDLARLLESIRYADFSQSFTNQLKGSGFEELQTTFGAVIKEFQQAKIEKEEHLRYLQTIVDHVGIALIAFNVNGNVELLNNAAKRLLNIPQLRNINQLEKLSRNLTETLTNLSPGDNRLIKIEQGDDLLQLSIYATGFVLRQEQLILASMQNIQTELEEKEMEAWQNLIRVLTHEIVNSITPIASLASTAHGLLKNSPRLANGDAENEKLMDVRDAVETIEKRSQGLLTFINNYRELTRIPKPNFQIVAVKDLFERIQTLMTDQFEQNQIDFYIQIDPETIEITADPNLIEQVLINLCKNSIEAVDAKTDPHIRLNAATDGLGNPVIKVIDNGKGIAEEISEKIFIPFYTTKPKGSGIGLSLSRQVMRSHKGTLSVISRPDVETIFALRF